MPNYTDLQDFYIPTDMSNDDFTSDFLPGLTANFQKLDKQLSFFTFLNGDKTGATQSTAAIQAFIDSLPDNSTGIIPPGTYWVEKNTALTDFPNGDQPCLLIRNKNNIRIMGYGATLVTRTHAQGILEIQLSDDIYIDGLKLQGYGSFPAIDTVTGYGEKGSSSGGYNTAGFWTYRKNNSYDTSGLTTGGNGGAAWGKFGGGFIGNVSYGVLVHRACNRITFRDCEAFGFNFAGFGIGHNGDYNPTDLGYADSYDVNFFNCNSHDNYSSGIHNMASSRVRCINCIVDRTGHPNASATHTYVDPGYGINMISTIYSKAKETYIHGCTLRGNKRKGIDSHSAWGLIATDNYIEDSMISGIFFEWSSPTQQSRDLIIANNRLFNIGYGKNPIAAIALDGESATYSKANSELNAIIKGNHLKNCYGVYGIIFIGVFDRVNVEGNLLHGVPDGLAANTFTVAAIYLGYSVPTSLNYMGNVVNNQIDFTDTHINRGIIVRNVQEGVCSGNTVKLEHGSVTDGIYLLTNDRVNCFGNTVTLDTVGNPLNAAGTNGTVGMNTLTGGNATFQPLQGQPVAFRITANTGNGTVAYKAGSQFVSSIVSDANGLAINLKNVPVGTAPMVKVSNAGSGGLTAGATVMGFFYVRTATATQVVIGIKASATASHTAFNTLTTGSLDIEITI